MPKAARQPNPAIGLMGRHEQARGIRWHCLVAMDHARPTSMTDVALLPVLSEIYSDCEMHKLRRELDYLAMKGLITLSVHPERPWQAKITGLGVDVVEYSIDCPPGIARPGAPERE